MATKSRAPGGPPDSLADHSSASGFPARAKSAVRTGGRAVLVPRGSVAGVTSKAKASCGGRVVLRRPPARPPPPPPPPAPAAATAQPESAAEDDGAASAGDATESVASDLVPELCTEASVEHGQQEPLQAPNEPGGEEAADVADPAERQQEEGVPEEDEEWWCLLEAEEQQAAVARKAPAAALAEGSRGTATTDDQAAAEAEQEAGAADASAAADAEEEIALEMEDLSNLLEEAAESAWYRGESSNLQGNEPADGEEAEEEAAEEAEEEEDCEQEFMASPCTSASDDGEGEPPWLGFEWPRNDAATAADAEWRSELLDTTPRGEVDLRTAVPHLARYLVTHPRALFVPGRRSSAGRSSGRYFVDDGRSLDAMADKMVTGCWACGKLDHESQACPFKRCFVCSQRGHEGNVCRFKGLWCRTCWRQGHEARCCPQLEYEAGLVYGAGEGSDMEFEGEPADAGDAGEEELAEEEEDVDLVDVEGFPDVPDASAAQEEEVFGRNEHLPFGQQMEEDMSGTCEVVDVDLCSEGEDAHWAMLDEDYLPLAALDSCDEEAAADAALATAMGPTEEPRTFGPEVLDVPDWKRSSSSATTGYMPAPKVAARRPAPRVALRQALTSKAAGHRLGVRARSQPEMFEPPVRVLLVPSKAAASRAPSRRRPGGRAKAPPVLAGAPSIAGSKAKSLAPTPPSVPPPLLVGKSKARPSSAPPAVLNPPPPPPPPPPPSTDGPPLPPPDNEGCAGSPPPLEGPSPGEPPAPPRPPLPPSSLPAAAQLMLAQQQLMQHTQQQFQRQLLQQQLQQLQQQQAQVASMAGQAAAAEWWQQQVQALPWLSWMGLSGLQAPTMPWPSAAQG
uniref:CCHC-type domain-containing protein n=1 Tax=Alexandrium monilatum TaxID=311494 RepID=A0A7S4R4V3_9DINO